MKTFRRTVGLRISSFGESEGGELYLTDLGGSMYRVIAPEFSDIASSTFLDHIHWLFYQGITGGCGGGRFCPRDTVTRGEMAAFVARAMHLPASPTDYFRDDNGTTHEANINRLAFAGIVGGCGGGNYCPNQTMTRAQMAAILARALSLPSTSVDFFDDDDGKTHERDINRLAQAGINGRLRSAPVLSDGRRHARADGGVPAASLRLTPEPDPALAGSRSLPVSSPGHPAA